MHRYSSDKQNDMSCEDQLAIARDTAQRLGFEIAGEFKDEAISGSNVDRKPTRRHGDERQGRPG